MRIAQEALDSLSRDRHMQELYAAALEPHSTCQKAWDAGFETVRNIPWKYHDDEQQGDDMGDDYFACTLNRVQAHALLASVAAAKQLKLVDKLPDGQKKGLSSQCVLRDVQDQGNGTFDVKISKGSLRVLRALAPSDLAIKYSIQAGHESEAGRKL